MIAHWRHWMQLANRCLEPAASFCEPTYAVDPVIGQKVWIWFVLDER
jgi:putative SOS response-associated peptidase YedK